jgi:peptide/nickel transport system permease protein
MTVHTIGLEPDSAPARTRRARYRGYSLTATAFLVTAVLVAVLAPWISPYPPTESHADAVLQGPTGEYLLGNDELGRDLLSRLMFGLRTTMLIALGTVAVAMVIGTIWGFAAAFGSRWLEEILMRTVDGLMAIPSFLLALMFVAAFGSSVTGLILIIGITNAPVVARVARAAVLEESSLDYVSAARASGASRSRVLHSEIFPNTVPVLLVQASLIAGYAIITEAGLSFLGLGTQPPTTSLGVLLLTGYQNIYSAPLYVVWPGLLVVALVWALNTVGDNTRQALDPRAANTRE